MKASLVLLALLPTFWLHGNVAAQAPAHTPVAAASSDTAAVLDVVQPPTMAVHMDVPSSPSELGTFTLSRRGRCP